MSPRNLTCASEPFRSVTKVLTFLRLQKAFISEHICLEAPELISHLPQEYQGVIMEKHVLIWFSEEFPLLDVICTWASSIYMSCNCCSLSRLLKKVGGVACSDVPVWKVLVLHLVSCGSLLPWALRFELKTWGIFVSFVAHLFCMTEDVRMCTMRLVARTISGLVVFVFGHESHFIFGDVFLDLLLTNVPLAFFLWDKHKCSIDGGCRSMSIICTLICE